MRFQNILKNRFPSTWSVWSENCENPRYPHNFSVVLTFFELVNVLKCFGFFWNVSEWFGMFWNVLNVLKRFERFGMFLFCCNLLLHIGVWVLAGATEVSGPGCSLNVTSHSLEEFGLLVGTDHPCQKQATQVEAVGPQEQFARGVQPRPFDCRAPPGLQSAWGCPKLQSVQVAKSLDYGNYVPLSGDSWLAKLEDKLDVWSGGAL